MRDGPFRGWNGDVFKAELGDTTLGRASMLAGFIVVLVVSHAGNW